MAGGRPTDNPKDTLIAVRFTDRQVRVLEARVRREGITLSEAVRRCVDESTRALAPRIRRPSPEERDTFRQVFGALGLRPGRR
jgi:hypothetical protein